MVKSVPQMLRESAATYEERNKLYGDNYKRFGSIMLELFPDGIELLTPEDHNRFGIFVQIVAKITRYAANFKTGGHDDSLLDNAVYSTMLRELDQAARDLRIALAHEAEDEATRNAR